MKKPKSRPRPKLVNTRKAIRKEKRQQKKLHRQEHYKKKKFVGDEKKFEPGKFVKLPTGQQEISKENKKKKNKKQPLFLEILNKERQKEMNVADKLKSEMEEQRRQMLLKANEDEEKVIKKLEKQLGLNKSKNKNNYFTDDGLDYLLEICDRTTSEQIVAAEKHLADVEGDSDFEEDLALVTGKELPEEKQKGKEKKGKSNLNAEEDSKDDFSMGESDEEESLLDGDESGEDKDLSNLDNEESNNESEMSEDDKSITKIKPNKKIKIVSEDNLSKVFSDDEVSHLSGDEDLDGSDLENVKEASERNQEKPDVWEDIYGRKRDKDGNVIKEEKSVYIPPHLRNKDSTSDKDQVQLNRQIKSILNKVSGSKLHWAWWSMEALYGAHSRRAVSAALCRQWSAATLTAAAAPDRLLADHAALLALLHANVASDVGAYFLEELCQMFDKMVDSEQAVEDKRLDNLTACLAYLYSFKMYHSALLYDILGRLLHNMSEKHCDCVLRALRCAGDVLRKDDPLALKTFIHDTQTRVAKMNEQAATGSRIKFLMEVLLAVKNNNLKKIPQYEPSYVESLRKTCRGLVRPACTITTLNVGLQDLLAAEERGKWWIVGSAWEGSRPLAAVAPAPAPAPAASAQHHQLLELARKQRMNTDVRRNIFCVIMAAQDFMDAFEKLQQLGLRAQQQREVLHVLLACCLHERTYNPYYALLAHKLCLHDRKYQLSMQFSVWDKMKQLQEASKPALANLVQLLVHLLMEKALPLSVLKIIQFSDLNKKSVRFMRQILLAVIMNADFQASLEVFHRVSKSPKLHMFRESLRLFIQHFLIKNAGKQSVLSEEEMATLKERASEVDKILTLHESKLKF